MTRLHLRSPRRIRPTRGAYLRLLVWMAIACVVILMALGCGFAVWWYFVMGY